MDGTLKFSSIQEYDDFFEDPEKFVLPRFSNAFDAYVLGKGKGNESFKLSEKDQESLEELIDTPLLRLLDDNFMVVIGEYLIKLDFEQRIAAVTKNINLKSNLENDDYLNHEIQLFSFDDDVLQLLIEGKSSQSIMDYINNRIEQEIDPNAATFCEGCDNEKCSLNSNKEGVSYSGNNFTYRLESKHVYQKAAIYFRLFSESKHMRRPSGSFLTWNTENTNLEIWYDVKFLSKKSGSKEQILKNSSKAFDNKLKIVYYEEGRGLEKYWVKSQFYAQPGGSHGYISSGAYWQFNLCDIKDNY